MNQQWVEVANKEIPSEKDIDYLLLNCSECGAHFTVHCECEETEEALILLDNALERSKGV